MPEIVFPGLASMVPVVRHAVRELLPDCPRLDDAQLVVSECVTNAVLHSRSGQADGAFRLVVESKPGWLRLEVHDDGPMPTRRYTAEQAGEHGNGWLLVDALADRWGHDGSAQRACTWVELDWAVGE